MKLRLSPIPLISILFFSLILITSCSKENSQTVDNQEREASVASSESDAEAEMVFNGLFEDVIGMNDDVGMAGVGVFGGNTPVGTGGGPNTGRPTTCHTVTITHPGTSFFPVVVVIDFGNTGCPGPDGHIRRGKIHIVYTNRLIIPGAMATTTFENFYIDSIRVEGTHRITNTSTVSIPPSRQFTVDVIHAKLTRPNGNFTEWDSHRTITQIEGLGTPHHPMDDAFRIEGSANGRVRRGALLVAWNSNIIEPLIKRFNCRWIVKGRIRTVRHSNSPNSPWVAVLDFGNGNCDNQAVITINGISHNITLH